MSIIEQAVRRLEELRRSGIEPPARGGLARGDVATVSANDTPVRVTRLTDDGRSRAADQPSDRPAEVQPRPIPLAGGATSKSVDIDLAMLKGTGYLTPETPRSLLADEFRIIKRPLLANVKAASTASAERANLIMVTSAMPGEGKTFVSINLAISLAMELDKTVLLVDADVSRPSVLTRLGLPQSKGLLDMLTTPALGLSDVLLRTNIPTLSLLPAGRPQGRATELLASDAMMRLVDDLASRYSDRILVFDAPPLLPSTESRVLATHMGQVVLVVEASRTSHKSVEQALAAIQECPVVLPLLNKITRSEVGSYYGYYAPAGD